MEPRERLAELARERGSSLAALSRMIGKNTAYLQQFITRGSPKKLEEDDRRKLAQFFGVAESELRGPEEVSYTNDSGGTDADWVEVSRLAVEASAGSGAMGMQDSAFDAFRFSRRWLREQGLEPAAISAIRVMGDSMEPLLRDGDEVLVDNRPQTLRDGIYVVRLDDTLLVKRIAAQGGGRISLLSQNLAYPPVSVMAEELAVIGRVVWKGGRL